jgi:soluble lytic murein transglycosylase
MKRFAVMALTTKECPRNFSLALSQKLEIHLDLGLENLKLIEALMDNGFACLGGDEPWFEYLTTRRALWAIVQQKFEDSLVYFDKALAAKELKEEYRTLYWKAYALEQLDRGDEALLARKRLAEKFPISWFTILSQTKRGIDPLSQVLMNSTATDDYSSGDEVVDRRGLWLQLLLEIDHSSDAVKKYSEFFVRALDTDLRPGFVQYIARSLDRNGFHRLQIMLLTKQNLANPEQLSRETLRLMYPKPFFEELDRHSKVLDTALLLGLARQESGFDPAAQSVADARGLLQILPSTARGIQRRFNKDDLFDYAKNIEIGARFVLSLIRSFDGSVEKSLAAYNAGPGNVRRWERRYGASEVVGPQLLIELIPFKETRDYVSSIMRNAYWYHRLFPELTQALDNKSVTSSLTLESLLFKDGDKRRELRFPASRVPTQGADPSLSQ